MPIKYKIQHGHTLFQINENIIPNKVKLNKWIKLDKVHRILTKTQKEKILLIDDYENLTVLRRDYQ